MTSINDDAGRVVPFARTYMVDAAYAELLGICRGVLADNRLPNEEIYAIDQVIEDTTCPFCGEPAKREYHAPGFPDQSLYLVHNHGPSGRCRAYIFDRGRFHQAFKWPASDRDERRQIIAKTFNGEKPVDMRGW